LWSQPESYSISNMQNVQYNYNKRLSYRRETRATHCVCWNVRCRTVVRITQTDRVSAWEALSANDTFYSATYVYAGSRIKGVKTIVLYTHRCNRLNYRTASMRFSVSHTYINAEISRTCDMDYDYAISSRYRNIFNVKSNVNVRLCMDMFNSVDVDTMLMKRRQKFLMVMNIWTICCAK